jgi:hypothetical protein
LGRSVRSGRGGSLLARRQIYAILFCMLSMSLACAAPDASPRYGLSIRAGVALDQALQELSRQTGIQIVYFSKITAGRSRGAELEVDGELAPGWLIGSGYAYNLYRTGDRSFPDARATAADRTIS